MALFTISRCRRANGSGRVPRYCATTRPRSYRKQRAAVAVRQGTSLFQLLDDLLRLLRRRCAKPTMRPVFLLHPYMIYFAATGGGGVDSEFGSGLRLAWTARFSSPSSFRARQRKVFLRSRHGRRHELWRDRLERRGDDRSLAELP